MAVVESVDNEQAGHSMLWDVSLLNEGRKRGQLKDRGLKR
jgi:hypothetical protein